MSNQARCHCQSCTIRGLTGPAIVITIGILFLLHQTRGGSLDFGNTWPVILVVMGLIYLGSALAPRDGHIEPLATPPSAPPASSAPPPPPQAPYSQGSD